MTPFPLKIVTPDGLEFEGKAEEVIVRTTSGDIGILAGHVNCVAPLGMGRATVVIDGQKRYGACIGGILSVVNGEVTLVPTTFEWADEIDAERAEASYQRAQTILQNKQATNTDIKLAEARLRRALVRKNVASMR
jgi:F-type H+-transporting ATPase subunit epsilon